MNYFDRIGLGRAALFVLLGYSLVVAAVLLVPRFALADDGDTDEPVFTPGIPGMTMKDVRDHKFLWYEIGQLQSWEQTNRISVAEYRSKVIEKTAHYLKLEDSDNDKFVVTARETVGEVRDAFKKNPPVNGNNDFTADLDAAVDKMNALLTDAPRHQLIEPEWKKWLLKLAFSPKESKEAQQKKESQQRAQVDI